MTIEGKKRLEVKDRKGRNLDDQEETDEDENFKDGSENGMK